MAVTTTQNPRLAGVRLSASDPALDGDNYTSGDLVLTTVSRGFYVAVDGSLVVDFLGGIDGRAAGTSRTFANVKAGTIIPGAFTKIYNGSTSGLILY